MKNIIKNNKLLRPFAKYFYFKFLSTFKSFPGSEDYWKERYESGGNSGAGSYGRLSEFKANILNSFVKDKNIFSVIEYGCGNGNQLKLSKYSSYIGFDVSPTAISICEEIFLGDETKSFKLMDEYKNETADLTLSLDVIYHLVEDNIYEHYMSRLFDSSKSFVVIYSSNTDIQESYQSAHVKHRKFSQWVESNRPNWQLIKYIANEHTSVADYKSDIYADFYIYENSLNSNN